ncbi:hypothetical protein BGCPKDLD_5278 [Methylorubrum suomiense]|uniref:Uncharacterized protein n=1 Tax=Methylorubrum suomiense TaxID=144191 RepID=A0ABQ4V235_9HYPH|nr:hypothetical protein BGCPKDLD_5278 [Methylorubrum suomiense]
MLQSFFDVAKRLAGLFERIWQRRNALPARSISTFDQVHDGAHRTMEANLSHRRFPVQGRTESFEHHLFFERGLNKDFLNFVTNGVKKLDTKTVSLATY